MLEVAVQQYLKAQGMSTVFVQEFGNYVLNAPAAIAVAAFPDRDAEFDGAYFARVQLRARHTSSIVAAEAGRTAYELLLAADGLTLTWDAPAGYTDRSYRLEAISTVNRPTWFPTAEAGEQVSSNVQLLVTEV